MPVVDLQRTTYGALPLWTFPSIEVPGLTLVVTGREGGVSTGPYASLNLGGHVGDLPSSVAVNALLLSSVFGGEGVTFVQQVHGDAVIEQDDVTSSSEADAIVVRAGRGAAGVRVADCVPIALIDPTSRVCVVVHAGWRGLARGVIEQAARVLSSETRQLIAAVGPSISQAAYQVGPEVVAQHDDFAQHAVPDEGDRLMLDLRAVTSTQLQRVGIDPSRQFLSRQVTDGGVEFFSDRAQRPCGRFALIAKWES